MCINKRFPSNMARELDNQDEEDAVEIEKKLLESV
jgi:hypothetical protein